LPLTRTFPHRQSPNIIPPRGFVPLTGFCPFPSPLSRAYQWRNSPPRSTLPRRVIYGGTGACGSPKIVKYIFAQVRRRQTAAKQLCRYYLISEAPNCTTTTSSGTLSRAPLGKFTSTAHPDPLAGGDGGGLAAASPKNATPEA